MLKLSELKPYKGATSRRKVVGRGVGSGHGTFSGRGAKGQKARSGSSIPVGFEGGRMPLHRQLPKRRGFKSRIPKAEPVSLQSINEKFKDKETVNPKNLLARGLIRTATEKIKILGVGEIKKSLTFEKVLISKSAVEKIERAGGKIIGSNMLPPAAK